MKVSQRWLPKRLGYSAVQSNESQRTFRRNLLPSSSSGSFFPFFPSYIILSALINFYIFLSSLLFFLYFDQLFFSFSSLFSFLSAIILPFIPFCFSLQTSSFFSSILVTTFLSFIPTFLILPLQILLFSFLFVFISPCFFSSKLGKIITQLCECKCTSWKELTILLRYINLKA